MKSSRLGQLRAYEPVVSYIYSRRSLEKCLLPTSKAVCPTSRLGSMTAIEVPANRVNQPILSRVPYQQVGGDGVEVNSRRSSLDPLTVGGARARLWPTQPIEVPANRP